MNLRNNEAEALGAAVKEAAVTAGSILVHAAVEMRDEGSFPTVFVNSEDAVKIINAITSRVIYLVEQAFDLAGELETALEEFDEIGVENSAVELKAMQRQFAKYNGQIGATIVSFMVDGVLHTAMATATWHDEFSDAVETILENAREIASVGQDSKNSERAKAIERNALVLVKHQSFNHGRVSFDKRMALAETLFQDCDPQTLSEITRRAENLFWLEQSGVKHDGA